MYMFWYMGKLNMSGRLGRTLSIFSLTKSQNLLIQYVTSPTVSFGLHQIEVNSETKAIFTFWLPGIEDTLFTIIKFVFSFDRVKHFYSFSENMVTDCTLSFVKMEKKR